MSDDAVVHEKVSRESGDLGVFGWIIIALLTVVGLGVSVGMFAVGILSVLGINVMPA